MKRIAAFTLYCLLIFPNIAQADNVIEFDDLLYAPDDSLRSKQLSGVEVMGEREWRENGIINCIPTKSERRLSNSPASLIKTMHLTYLKEKDGAIVNLMGEVVPVFINGKRASQIDLETFWPKEVKRVQYLEHPADPRYEGASAVVNFIMPEYKVGGVTRVNLFKRFPNNGYYTAASKLVRNNWTYGLMVRGNYERDHLTSQTGKTEYRDFFYKNQKYETLTRTENRHSYSRENGVQTAWNARYVTDKTTISHDLSFGWNENPGSGSLSQDVWSDNLFDASHATERHTAKSLSPQIYGLYYFKFSDKWFLSNSWKYAYAENTTSAFSQIGKNTPILNGTNEKVNSLKIVVMPSFIPSKKWFFQLYTTASLDWFSTCYIGSANLRQKQARQDVTASFKMGWYPNDDFGLTLEPGMAASFWKIGQEKQHTVIPTMNASASWSPSKKVYLRGRLGLYMRPASPSESNPVLLQNSELMWSLGNPNLKNLTSWDTYIYSSYLATKWLSLSYGLGYVKTKNEIITTYRPASFEQGGLVKELVNPLHSEDRVMANISIDGSFFNDNLSVSISPEWSFVHVQGARYDKFHHVTFSGSIDYKLKDVEMGISYKGPYKDVDESGMRKTWRQGAWGASITYGNGNLYLSFQAENIFSKRNKRWEQFTSPYYSSRFDFREKGRAFTVNLTYTFGYGKKVDRSIDISGPSDAKTSVLHGE